MFLHLKIVQKMHRLPSKWDGFTFYTGKIFSLHDYSLFFSFHSTWHNNKPLTLLSLSRFFSFGQPINYKYEYFTVFCYISFLCYFVFLSFNSDVYKLISHTLWRGNSRANLFTQTSLSFRASISLKFVLAKKIYFMKLNFRTHRSTLDVLVSFFFFSSFVVGLVQLCSWLLRATSQYLSDSSLFFVLIPLWWWRQRRIVFQLAVFGVGGIFVLFFLRCCLVSFGVERKIISILFFCVKQLEWKENEEEKIL